MIALAKLLLTEPSSTMPQAQIFAIRGTIIQPQLYTAWSLNAELLSSHAAHCMHISPTGNKFICYYPSQPIYASAAHQFLARDDANWVACIDGLTRAVQQGLVTIGDAEELTVNVILMRAMNQTMKKQLTWSTEEKKVRRKENLMLFDDEDKSIPYGHPVRLKDFLQVLTGKDADQIFLGSTKDDLGIKKKLLDEGVIIFKHMILIKYTPNANDSWKNLHRGLAVHCRPRQPGFNQLFTIYFKPISATSNSASLDAKNVSFCGIQVKNHQEGIQWSESYKWTQRFAGIQDIHNAYLVIPFNLSGNIPGKPKVVKRDDKNRAVMQIHGLEDIGCLTTEIAHALHQLKSAQPDLLQATKPDRKKIECIKSINPRAFPEGAE
ncbi:hypothetical protein PCANC_02299 [Puccinia coronata f. sp. avenae]|uniref:Uncharacterized protein n=1 Tax=Puccinia coronata f. sp. avenae TaxID=200324 RepID=A0A2N5VQP1_9BASI|nr:hypothetical protein PCASD_00137 [Puccinia coronata f. sp. avenae]PLW55395.1 hypothetical protein PCANC_02299 [Puccinia coronata f. sp. avenae]